jgi:hypothetical protein
MGTCQCAPPAQLHLRPDGVHLPDGRASTLIVVDEGLTFDLPRCSVCATAIHDTFFRCAPCDAAICRACLALDTHVAECDCLGELQVTGVQSAARRAAAALR